MNVSIKFVHAIQPGNKLHELHRYLGTHPNHGTKRAVLARVTSPQQAMLMLILDLIRLFVTHVRLSMSLR